MMARVSLVVGGAIASAFGAEGLSSQTMKQIPVTPVNGEKATLHYEFELKATPQRVYHLLLSSKEFAACTGLPAEIDAEVGGAFSLFGGQIVGRNVDLVPGQRIVQAWRPAHWDAGSYSIVKFELKAHGAASTVILDHTGFPVDDADSLDKGWHEHYLDKLKKYFG
jgi:activator of HSP90 ATPase